MINDKNILATLIDKIGVEPNEAAFDDDGRLIKLDLSELNLSELPPEIGRLRYLRELDLSGNQLKDFPQEIWQLVNLQKFWCQANKLSQISPEIKNLVNLQVLNIFRNHLIQIPVEIGQLHKLKDLNLGYNELSQLPNQIWQLTKLEELWLAKNKISSLSSGIAQLSNLRVLGLHRNNLSQLPAEIHQLPNLSTFGLSIFERNVNLLTEIFQLVNLRILFLVDGELEQLPSDIKNLSNLQQFNLDMNQLESLPSEITELSNLEYLSVTENKLVSLPSDIKKLKNLWYLNLNNNKITHLPDEICDLKSLELEIDVKNNPLRTPPPEIAAQGTEEILDFMRDLQKGGVTRYEAKLLLVGEGRAGKTSLLRALHGEPFDAAIDSTHGIEVRPYMLPHPDKPDQPITLNAWDFGGQHIYQSTHQFFLTERSLYLVVWNAGVDVEQAGLDKWLKNIQVVAPNSPVLLVATHSDQRQPDVNYPALQARYPQLAGHYAVSNKTGAGIEALKTALVRAAADLPLMEQQWPETWIAAEQALLSRPEHHLSLNGYTACCVEPGLKADIACTTFSGYLHDLGKILHFQDDDLLTNLVVLKPNWITKAISRVLVDAPTRRAVGILSHADLPRIWARDEEGRPYDRRLYPIFLRLMERFDLSYQIEPETPGENASHSLVPLLLPYEPPAGLSPWPEKPPSGQMQVEMVYRLDFAPPGLMSWFIVRTHRYTAQTHWREGVVLAYKGHQARAELNPLAREIRLAVWGAQPQNFFTILKETLDLILGRFEGLTIRRDVPCICHWQSEEEQPCPRFYRYEDLARRMEKGRLTVECPESFEDVSVPTLLYGIHTSTEPQVVADIRRMKVELKAGQRQILAGQAALQERLEQQSELIVRNFTRRWNLEMKKLEAECPNTFILMPESGSSFNPKNWISDVYRLYLVCQHPAGPHVVGKGYDLRQGEQWWVKLSPWLGYLLKFLKYGLPLNQLTGLGDAAGLTEEGLKQIETGVKLLEQINNDLPQLETAGRLSRMAAQPHFGEENEITSPALRALHSFLKEADPDRIWGGLRKTITPDGNILWLCAEHRRVYEVAPLVI